MSHVRFSRWMSSDYVLVIVFVYSRVEADTHHPTSAASSSPGRLKKQFGAVEARRAHNPEVARSKRAIATCLLSFFVFFSIFPSSSFTFLHIFHLECPSVFHLSNTVRSATLA
ncbi:hypothetical protein M440DRAFT_1004342 [Trichoderma longibrachiatum ATCC 18648]|uniref:Secreted protein n=1 Tax=Trichoderma longibrachiatum ATCC 18648 TaxID=983965 RepID=A0A2T4CHC7_TRILO|nr:hypothetical protein M440DRAFT_1004342 [Trichoderma longibrachiatum ATCC 18648]